MSCPFYYRYSCCCSTAKHAHCEVHLGYDNEDLEQPGSHQLPDLPTVQGVEDRGTASVKGAGVGSEYSGSDLNTVGWMQWAR